MLQRKHKETLAGSLEASNSKSGGGEQQTVTSFLSKPKPYSSTDPRQKQLLDLSFFAT